MKEIEEIAEIINDNDSVNNASKSLLIYMLEKQAEGNTNKSEQ